MAYIVGSGTQFDCGTSCWLRNRLFMAYIVGSGTVSLWHKLLAVVKCEAPARLIAPITNLVLRDLSIYIEHVVL